MSTNLPKTNLALIFHYGREALSNRRKDLFLITLLFILIPELLDFFVWQSAAAKSVSFIRDLQNTTPLSQLETIFGNLSSMIFAPTLIFGLVKVLGLLVLARSCVDYFESRPGPLGSVTARATRVLLTKGLGVLLLLLTLMPVLVLLPFLRALAMSMLVMLPVTLVASHQGGFRTAWDTVFLKYATTSQFGRWPVFINVLSVTGIFLTAYFGLSILIEQVALIDTVLEIPAGILGQDINFAGIHMNAGRFVVKFMEIAWEAFAITVIIPFTAAIYHLSTAPSDHVSFSTNV